MELEHDLWLVGAFYVDIDQNRQLRIVGPNNHLYFGANGLYGDDIKVISATERDGELCLTLEIHPPSDFLHDPAMGHIRRVRQFTQLFGRGEPTFAEVEGHNPGVLAPQTVSISGSSITYRRSYGEHFYGTTIEFPDGTLIERDEKRKGIKITGTSPWRVFLFTDTDILPKAYSGPLLSKVDLDLSALPPNEATFATRLLDRSAVEIEHLVRHNKTSGYDYGTVFPRDWMEAADLGANDFTPSALRHLYIASLKHVNEKGAGWHEDVVGEFEYERKQELASLTAEFESLVSSDHPFTPEFHAALRQFDELIITRLMIDIEPHYILGLLLVKFEELDQASRQKLQLVAKFVVEKASEFDLITFNRIAMPFRRTKDEEYYSAGNWRDSTLAFKRIHPVIAPYDVNAVLYPQALRVIRDHASELGMTEVDLDALIRKWDRTKDWYRITNPDGSTAFALALYDVRQGGGNIVFSQLHVNHIDEAYDLFYGQPLERDVASFAERLVDPNYFFTPSGPTLVGHGDGYDHSQYHGEVIWIKQTAYVVAGLERQLARGIKENWDKSTLTKIEDALWQTACVSLKAFTELGDFPELHYDDNGKPRLYIDQPAPEGQMNLVQLWSAVGARQILRSYLRHLERRRGSADSVA
jgi:hypothetical protein